MREALLEARAAEANGEVPVGAVIVRKNEIIARAHNETEARIDATAHAEVLAIQRAGTWLGDWRLNDCSLFVTLEPCSMCIGAMILSRLTELYFGAADPKQGAVGSLYDLSGHPELPHTIAVGRGVLEDECQNILRSFFLNQRDPAAARR